MAAFVLTNVAFIIFLVVEGREMPRMKTEHHHHGKHPPRHPPHHAHFNRPVNHTRAVAAAEASAARGDNASELGQGRLKKWCCLRTVHVGKTGGETVQSYATTHTVEFLTMHHVYSYFEERRLLYPYCLFGTTLRHPVSLFVSAFWWCRSRNCVRPHYKCGK